MDYDLDSETRFLLLREKQTRRSDQRRAVRRFAALALMLACACLAWKLMFQLP
jgi:ferric-dicitrate binding protein FerR (iron transport regulator)